MGMVVLLIFLKTKISLISSIFIMISHSFISTGLFILADFLYKQFHTRFIIYYKGIINKIPIFSFYFFSFLIFNMGFPPSLGFIGEFLYFFSIVNNNISFFILIANLIIVIYTIFILNKIIFNKNISLTINYFDFNIKYNSLFFILLYILIFFGVFPNLIFECLNLFLIMLI